jgi:hypothetical protein
MKAAIPRISTTTPVPSEIERPLITHPPQHQEKDTQQNAADIEEGVEESFREPGRAHYYCM